VKAFQDLVPDYCLVWRYVVHSLQERFEGTGEVIKCWDEGVKQMSKGQSATLSCTADYAYGKRGAGSIIPPNADLKFDVELIDFEEGKK